MSYLQKVEEAYDAYPIKERDYWVLQWPGQTVLCVSMTYWTSEVTAGIRKGMKGLTKCLKQENEQIAKIVDLVRGKLSLQNRITLGALVVLDVHARDVVQLLIDKSVEKDNDFQWLCQLRYYWRTKVSTNSLLLKFMLHVGTTIHLLSFLCTLCPGITW